nr:serine/threonine-protein kinase [Nanchangia anserum]
MREQLGTGGMGTVYRACGPDGATVALKLLHPALAGDEQARRRMQREAAVLTKVASPGVAAIIDWEIDTDQPFVVTEYVNGPTLADDVRHQGAWNREDLADLAQRLAEILRAVHAAGIIHRDIKPSNIMLSAAGPVLIDFGIAQLVDGERLTQTGRIMGTPGYVPPELIGGQSPSEASDWWAWASVLLYCATGRAPFGSGPFESVLARVVHSSPDLEGLDSELADILRAGLRAEPDQRADAFAIATALAQAPGTCDLSTLRAPEAAATQVLSAPEGGQDTATTLLDGERTRPLTPADMTPPAPPAAYTAPNEPRPYPGAGTQETRVFAGASPSAPPPYPVAANPALGLDAAAATAPAASMPEAEQSPWDGGNARHHWYTPYRPPRHVVTWPMSLAALLCGAALTLHTQLLMPVVAACAVVVLACYGHVGARLEAERMQRGFASDGDVSRALVALPGGLLRALAGTAGAAVLVTGGAWAAWWGLQLSSRGASSPWTLRQALLFPQELLASERAQLWGVIVVMAMIGWASPMLKTARSGYQRLCAQVLSPWWLRLVIVAVLLIIAWASLSMTGVGGVVTDWMASLVSRSSAASGLARYAA